MCSIRTGPKFCRLVKGYVQFSFSIHFQTTPLHLAAKYGHTEVVELLIDWDADVEQRDSDGNNCMDLAIDNNNRY